VIKINNMKNIKRRTFFKGAAAASALTLISPSAAFGSRANSAIRMGIIGCGGRGSAVISSIIGNTNTALVAMADLFDDKLRSALPVYNKLNSSKSMPDLPKGNIYQGSKAYLALLNNKDVDAVLVSTPCYSHPQFVEAAIAAGKHVYCEKPAATDVTGSLQMIRTGEAAERKGLNLAIGFQIRFATAYVEMIKRIKEGLIGDVINAQIFYFSGGVPVRQDRSMSYDEARIRNHFHFRTLSGGILADQGIHVLDVCNWGLGTHPLRAMGTGGNRNASEFGDTWTNYQVIYQYPGDVNVSFHSTQQGSHGGDVCARFIGTKGIAEAHYSGGVFIEGENRWDSGVARAGQKSTEEQRVAGIFLSSLHDADRNKDIAFINTIESGKPINEALQGAESTLTAILGRMAATSGEVTTWDEMMLSGERLDPMLDLAQFDKPEVK